MDVLFLPGGRDGMWKLTAPHPFCPKSTSSLQSLSSMFLNSTFEIIVIIIS